MYRTYQKKAPAEFAPTIDVTDALMAAKAIYNDLDADKKRVVASMDEFSRKSGGLTVRQVSFLKSIVDGFKERQERVKVEFRNIFTAMEHARSNGALKQPRMTFTFEQRAGLTLKFTEARNYGADKMRPAVIYVFQNQVYAGSINHNGNGIFKSYMSADNISFLRELDHDFFGVAAREGKRMGACCFCSRTLTDPVSLEHGYGPICARHYRSTIQFNVATAPSQVGRV